MTACGDALGIGYCHASVVLQKEERQHEIEQLKAEKDTNKAVIHWRNEQMK